MTDVMPAPSGAGSEGKDRDTVEAIGQTSSDTSPSSMDQTKPEGSSADAHDSENLKQRDQSAVERIKAAQAARRGRRARPTPPQVGVAVSADFDESSEDPALLALKKAHEKEVAVLRQEAASLRLEMGSLRRNHLQNIKKLSDERDMFATQLANEQTSSGKGSKDERKIDDINVQLRAARTRNADLENENAALREDVKQLNFRVHASKTLSAASDGYEKIVDDLVTVKLKCAQLQEEKEDLLRINRELMGSSTVLREANGELEKSRSDWVLRCAELEKQKQELEKKLNDPRSKGPHVGNDASDSGSLQDIKLN